MLLRLEEISIIESKKKIITSIVRISTQIVWVQWIINLIRIMKTRKSTTLNTARKKTYSRSKLNLQRFENANTKLFNTTFFQAKKENKEAKEYYKKLSTRLEIECRILFPLSFFGFLVCYIVYYYFITDDSTTVMQGMTPYDEFAQE